MKDKSTKPTNDTTPTEAELLDLAVEQITGWAAQHTPLDWFPIHFAVVPPHIMYEIGSYGLPGRFSHWTHGRAYHQMKTGYDYGLSKIYELIINTNPAQAFLMDVNSLTQNKLVIAHVIGHSDFFKNNVYFGHTDRQMAETAALHAERIRRYEFEHGQLEVERFLDAILSIEEHIDPNLHSKRLTDEEIEERRKKKKHRKIGLYDDLWELKDRNKKIEPEKPIKFPQTPDKDLLQFIASHSPKLEDWQRDLIAMLRMEMIYFLPQMKTKIMNEGWASYWHREILLGMELSQEEDIEISIMHAGVLSPSGHGRAINPYYIGFKVIQDIRRRWDGDLEPEERERYKEANHGRDWTHKGEGLAKLLEVRETEDDASFLRNYLTQELVRDLDLYTYRKVENEWVVVETDWRVVRDRIVDSMTNFGFPYIVVQDGDYNGNRELLLKHCFEGRELDHGYAQKTLESVHLLWPRSVHLETMQNGQPVTWSYDGENHIMAVGAA